MKTTEKPKTKAANKGVTPVMQQYLRLKEEYSEEILFFRLGDFYEMFFDDALRAAPLLEVALTKRQGTPMCGVPYHAAPAYLSKLIKAGKSVAIAEQLEDPKKTKGMVKRGVVRVLTPGTVVEDELLPSKAHNFLMAVAMISKNGRSGHWALACADVSTGKQWVGEVEDDLNWNTLKAQISLLNPTEILLMGASPQKVHSIFNTAASLRYEPVPAGAMGLPAQVLAGIQSYLKRHHEAALKCLQKPEPLPLESGGMMFLDQTAIRHLELVESTDHVNSGPTLISVLDKTKSALGSRLLRWWALHPSTDIHEINLRLDQVQELHLNTARQTSLRDILKEVPDIERISVRTQSGIVSPRELAALRHGLNTIPRLKTELSALQTESTTACFDPVLAQLDVPVELMNILEKQLKPEPPAKLADGNIIEAGVSPELDELRAIRRSGRTWIAQMEAAQRESTGITNLKVGYNDVFGYYLEVSKSHLSKVPGDWVRKQTLANAERYITPELKEQEEKILGAQDRILALETKLFNELVAQIASFGLTLSHISDALARIDVLATLAYVAAQNSYVRPHMTSSHELNIKKGRHPVIEKELGREKFISNDMVMGDQRQIAIITGPNMAGKSTYLRQAALIVIMAQMGSFVPAEDATIGIVDKIFTRIGASDRLSQGQSTFMVEMQEVATLLLNASPRSLLVLDEVGRGTSTYDGMSIAWAVIESLVSKSKDKPGPRTLFATHYFELTQLADTLPGVFNAHATAKEWPGEEGRRQVVFLYQILDGAADRSYGIHVAEMAGIPESVIGRAREILHQLETGSHQVEKEPTSKPKQQMDLFTENPIVDEIRKIDMDHMTPMAAFEALIELKKKV